MKYRAPAKNYDLFSALSSQRKNRSHKRGILKLREVIDWAAFGSLLEEVAGYSQRDAKKGGRPPFEPVFMFKVLILQKYYGLRICLDENIRRIFVTLGVERRLRWSFFKANPTDHEPFPPQTVLGFGQNTRISPSPSRVWRPKPLVARLLIFN